VASLMCADAEAILGDLDSARKLGRGDLVGTGPRCVSCSGGGLDAALVAIADFVDLKSPFTLGHGRAVSELVAGRRSAARPPTR